jgi:aminoglycoside 3-N-acetyltransferase
MVATRSSLAADLRQLGVTAGSVMMVHASVRSVGPVTGGVNVIVQALQDAVGPTGTIVAYVDFEPFYGDGDDEIPVFDKRIAHAARDHGVLHETLRTWPGALRSDHPDAGVVALGKLAGWIVSEHPFRYGYGEGSPFERVLEAQGKVLMLGAPLDTITLLHCAEHRARIPDKRIVTYRRLMPGPGADGPAWVTFEEFDTSEPINPLLPEDCFERIARACLASGRGTVGHVGQAPATLFDGRELVAFGVDWLEQWFASHPSPRSREEGQGEG